MHVDAPSKPSTPPGHSPGAPSFDEIYERHGARILNLAYRMTGNAETARDLAQEVWLRVYERLDTFEGRADLYTWIHRIAVNHVLNHLKREKRARWLNLLDLSVGEAIGREQAEALAAITSRAPGADRQAEADERGRRVWEAIQSLDPMYRVPLVLFYYEDRSYNEIADTMSLSLAAVEARIHRARKQVAKKLGPLLGHLL
jgi:RNA polymerase sigma-70 factor (ECF subfamily)